MNETRERNENVLLDVKCLKSLKNIWFKFKKEQNEVKCKFLLKEKYFTSNESPRLLKKI